MLKVSGFLKKSVLRRSRLWTRYGAPWVASLGVVALGVGSSDAAGSPAGAPAPDAANAGSVMSAKAGPLSTLKHLQVSETGRVDLVFDHPVTSKQIQMNHIVQWHTIQIINKSMSSLPPYQGNTNEIRY
jgi:hypothetical protein